MVQVRSRGRVFESRGDEVQEWVEEHCVFSNGRWTGQPFRLLKWQRNLLLELFEVRDDGLRRYRRALIGVGRKNGKTELAAAVGLYLAFGEGEPSAEVYCAAASEDQADRVFEAARRMVELSPTLSEEISVPVGLRSSQPRLSGIRDRYSYLQRLTSKGKTKHGLNPHAVVLDELHAWGVGEAEELWDALNTGSAARRQPLQLAITTAGVDVENSRCGLLYQLGKRLEGGEQEDDTYFFRWWEAPEGCDHRDPEAWHAANPSMGEIVDDRFYEGELGVVPEATFRRLYLNQWTEAGEYWLPPGAYEACAGDATLLEDVPIAIGWDASTKHDSTAIVIVQQVDDELRVQVRVWERPVDPFGRPVADWLLPIAECMDHIRVLCRTHDVMGIAYDPAFITWAADELVAEGLPAREWPQTNSRMVPGTQATFEAFVRGEIRHGGDPVLARHIRAAVPVAARDGSGQRLSKREVGRHNDAAIALVMAVGLLRKVAPEEVDLTFYA